eukprot:jgi/Bigna1/146521/aug1.116_g21229
MGYCDSDYSDDDSGLISYPSIYCSESTAARGFTLIVFVLWGILLLSLLASTADRHFIPQLEWLSNFLRLRPEVAGITLLALGNGAPDVFTALAGIQDADDFQLVLGALLGASTFISTVVLGAVLLSVRVPEDDAEFGGSKYHQIINLPNEAGDRKSLPPEQRGPDGMKAPKYIEVDAVSFTRDIVAYLVATIAILVISLNGKISLYEAISLLCIYFAYVGFVIIYSRCKQNSEVDDESLHKPNNDDGEDLQLGETVCAGMLQLEGIAPPPPIESNAFVKTWMKIQWLMEWPFSIIRWCSIPEADGIWGSRQAWLTAISLPIGFYLVYTDFVANEVTWDFIATVMISVACGIGVLCLLLHYCCLQGTQVPSWYWVVVTWALISTIVWLDLEAGEAVALAGTLGSLASISSAVMGITVLAWGNSVGDLVADTAAARVNPRMAVASCFGSPMLNDLIGLGLSLTVTTVNRENFEMEVSLGIELYVAWGFLLTALFSSLGVFYLCGRRLPRIYAYFLFALYAAFLATQIGLVVNDKVADPDSDDSD